jgi:hypothetical protein
MDVERIKARLREIAGRRKNVRFDELINLLDNHIGPLFENYNHHGKTHHAFTVGSQTFNIPEPKGKFVMKYAVDKFLDKMEAVGLFEPEDDDANA